MNCTICYECYTERDSFNTPCNHTFHKECLKTWFNTQSANNRTQTCPLCRRELTDVLNEMPTQARRVYIENARHNGIIINEAYAVLTVGVAEHIYHALGLQDSIGLNLRGLTDNFSQALEVGRRPGSGRPLVQTLFTLLTCAIQTDKNNKRR